MANIIRIHPLEVDDKLKSGAALLVCAYPGEDKFQNNHLDGALSFTDFQAKLSDISKDQEIVFYCA